MAKHYDDLLTLCGWERDEIEDERPRIEEAFRRLELGPEDMKPAENWVRTYQDVSLVGVRKLLGAWIKELIDMILAKDEGLKPVYYGMPAITGPGFIMAGASDDVFVCCPDYVLVQTIGSIFNKLTPIIIAGEQNGAPPGHALCSLWQVRMGGMAKGIIPVPAMTISSSYFCDMSAIGDTLMRGLYGTTAAVIDSCMDGRWGEFPDVRPERIAFLGEQINNALKKAGEILNITITPDAMEKGTRGARECADRIARLIELMRADPVPLNAAGLQFLEGLAPASTRRGITEGNKALDILIPELEERVAKGIGSARAEEGRPEGHVLPFAHRRSQMQPSRGGGWHGFSRHGSAHLAGRFAGQTRQGVPDGRREYRRYGVPEGIAVRQQRKPGSFHAGGRLRGSGRFYPEDSVQLPSCRRTVPYRKEISGREDRSPRHHDRGRHG